MQTQRSASEVQEPEGQALKYADDPSAPTVTNGQGGKQSDSPYRCDCLPAAALLETAKVLKLGADKYGAENWRKIDTRDHVNHAVAHLLNALYQLQTGDPHPEQLQTELAHASCRVLFALDLQS